MRRRFAACRSSVLKRYHHRWLFGNGLEKPVAEKARGLAALGRVCGRLLHYLSRFRDRLIGRTSAFGAEYRGSSPRPGTRFPSLKASLPPPRTANSDCRCAQVTSGKVSAQATTFRGSSAGSLQSSRYTAARVEPLGRALDSRKEGAAPASATTPRLRQGSQAGYDLARRGLLP